MSTRQSIDRSALDRPAVERWSSWQAMDSGRLLLLAISGMLVLAAFASLAVTTDGLPVMPAVAFGLFIAFRELLRLALPGGREAAPIAMAGAMGYALLLGLKGSPSPHLALQVVAVAAIGMTIGALPHVAAGRPFGITGICTPPGTVA